MASDHHFVTVEGDTAEVVRLRQVSTDKQELEKTEHRRSMEWRHLFGNYPGIFGTLWRLIVSVLVSYVYGCLMEYVGGVIFRDKYNDSLLCCLYSYNCSGCCRLCVLYVVAGMFTWSVVSIMFFRLIRYHEYRPHQEIFAEKTV